MSRKSAGYSCPVQFAEIATEITCNIMIALLYIGAGLFGLALAVEESRQPPPPTPIDFSVDFSKPARIP